LIDKWHLKDDVLMNIEQMVYMDAMKPSASNGNTIGNGNKPSQISLPSSSSTPKNGPVQSPTRISPPTPSRGDRGGSGVVGPSPSRPGTHARITTGAGRPASGAPIRNMDTPTNLNSQLARESVTAPASNSSPPPGEYDDRPIRRSTSTEYAPNGAPVFTFGAIPQAGGIGSSGPPSTASTRSGDDRSLGTARTSVRKGMGTGGGSLATSAKKKTSSIATTSERSSLFSSSGTIGSAGSDRKDRTSSSGGTDSATSSLRGPSARRKPALDSGSGHR
jgi:hypothetical protein